MLHDFAATGQVFLRRCYDRATGSDHSLVGTSNSLISTSRISAIRFKSFRWGCDLLLHIAVTILGFLPSRAANSFWLISLITDRCKVVHWFVIFRTKKESFRIPDSSGWEMTLLLDFLKKNAILIYNSLMHDPRAVFLYFIRVLGSLMPVIFIMIWSGIPFSSTPFYFHS